MHLAKCPSKADTISIFRHVQHHHLVDVASGVGSGSDISNTFQRSCSSVRELSTGEPGVCSKSDGQNKSLSCSGVPWPAGMLSNVRVDRKGTLSGDTKSVVVSPNNAVISLWALSCGYKRHSGHRALSGLGDHCKMA